MDHITEKKAQLIQERDGYVQSGVVLCHPETGHRCIVEKGAVRWISNEEMWEIMHPKPTIPS